MANTETHYISYDPEEVWDEMIDAYIDAGGDVLYAGDEKEILLRAVLAIAVAIMSKVDVALRMDTLTYASREYLDLYGEKRNCPRIKAAPARATVQISFNNSNFAQIIRAGTELTADGVVLYHLTEDVEQTGFTQTVRAEIECSEAGAIGNGLAEGTQMQFITSNSAVASIYTTTDATGGEDEEEEEDYRERIRNFGLASVTTGPSAIYEGKALEVSSEILDAKALNDGDGSVGVYLVLDEDASVYALLNAVTEALSAQDVRPLTDEVAVHVASAVDYTLHVKVWYPSGMNLATAITQAKDEYQAWQDHKVGRAFNPDKLTASLYQLGATRVQYANDDGIDGAGAVYTEIEERQHCAGDISVELVVTT